jgi:hypothetical protein
MMLAYLFLVDDKMIPLFGISGNVADSDGEFDAELRFHGCGDNGGVDLFLRWLAA